MRRKAQREFRQKFSATFYEHKDVFVKSAYSVGRFLRFLLSFTA